MAQSRMESKSSQNKTSTVDARLFARSFFGLLFLVASGLTYHLAVTNKGQLALKVSLVAALLLRISFTPPPSPFAGKDREVLRFYRNRLGLIGGMFLPISLFAVFWIQMPHERLPHFNGIVTGYAKIEGDSSGASYPVVDYYDDQQIKHTIVDNFALIMFPGKTFQSGEEVSVTSPQCRPGLSQCSHIREAFFSRWWLTLFLLTVTISTIFVALLCQFRLVSLPPAENSSE